MTLRFDRYDIREAMLAGLTATGIMSLFMAWLPTIGFPEVDVPAHIVQPLVGREVELGEPIWWLGFGVHFGVGAIVLPILFLLLKTNLGWPDLPTGWTLGACLWLLGEGVIIPLTGGGVFSSAYSRWELIALQDLMAHLVYGTVLAMLCKHRQLTRRSMQ